jgi:hypothetical protein
MEECNTGITIIQTAEECQNNYVSTNCVATPNAITYLDLSAGASQTQINANIVSALMRKDEQISEIPIANGSETKIVAGTNVTVTGTGTNLSNYVISAIVNTPTLDLKTINGESLLGIGNLTISSPVVDYRPYKVYTALLNQTGTSNPVARVLENTLGGSIVWTRNSTGTYLGTLTGIFTTNKTTVMITNGSAGSDTVAGYAELDYIVLFSHLTTNGSTSDSVYDNATIEIRVYN